MLRTLFATSALTLAVAFMAPAFADSAPAPRTISLSGHGETRMAPDLAMVNVGVISQAATAAEALAANSAAMTAMFEALDASGIDRRDVQTSNFMVQPRYDFNNDGRAPTLAGYEVSNNVSVTVRKLDGLGALLDRVVQSGSNQINGVSFGVEKPDGAFDEARKRAVTDAQRKAQVYAAASGVTLGEILSIAEGAGYQPAPMQAKIVRAGAMAESVPIAEGEQVMAIDVNITWAIK